jgi:hypothetical protein
MQNGKGDKDNRVTNRLQYRENLDRILENSRKRTWCDWAQLLGDTIMDADGFRNNPMDTRYSREEYQERLNQCTILLKKI